jgi:regulatory protein
MLFGYLGQRMHALLYIISMTITKIENQKKNKERFNVFIDGQFACGINGDTLVKFGLSTNDEISEDTLNEIKNFDEYLYSKKISYDFLSYRVRSEKEIRDKLKLKEISSGTIEKTILHLKELKLLDDEEFARQLVKEKLSSKPAGKAVLKQKLYQKGVHADIINRVLEESINDTNEKDFVKEIFNKYFHKVKGLDIVKQRKKMFDYLARKGFDFEIIKEVINENINT